MAKDILSEYGPDSKQPQGGKAGGGGHIEPKPLHYLPPVGPTTQTDPATPGLHGTNHGNSGTQGRH